MGNSNADGCLLSEVREGPVVDQEVQICQIGIFDPGKLVSSLKTTL